ncbi:hypothetical protein [Paenibacillus physcomitrellae]|uniref:DUF4230 domain-containing protein n=1 Tax=Paenibacillus physcomitrellae TaxID=1619311 RepID=A0ABQ1FNY8_9BACL|nr:hypothetical protein [Paenibacillus physcomitrellae]GGA24064.1 hypothetical protein GCM10010917_06080 [Paenibacillus physcomitrellae]
MAASGDFLKKLKLILLLLLITALVAGAVYIIMGRIGRPIDVAVRGVNYQLGPENSKVLEPETLHLKGTLYRSWKGSRTFKGSVTFDHQTIEVPKGSEEATISFDKKGYGPLWYWYSENNETAVPQVYSNGALFASADFSAVTFLRYRDYTAKNGTIQKEWSGEDGLMFAGPAANREEALEVSNRLMKEYLTDNGYAGGRFVLK